LKRTSLYKNSMVLKARKGKKECGNKGMENKKEKGEKE
jgi:hypothetical protein